MSAKSILVLHGPNLNMLGTREPAHYGTLTLVDIDTTLADMAKKDGVALESFQSNSEADIVSKIQSLMVNRVDYITHTSVAIRDAVSAVSIPFVEVHLSNVYAREQFRHHSYFSDIAVGVISGLGAEGYFAAYRYITKQ